MGETSDSSRPGWGSMHPGEKPVVFVATAKSFTNGLVDEARFARCPKVGMTCIFIVK
jgi:hypothetical protein